MEDHQEVDDHFKVPLDNFARQLDVLEQYNNGPKTIDHISRMSLYKQFDPLVEASKSPPGQPIVIKNDIADNEFKNEEATLNESATLICINTPAPKNHHHHENKSPLRSEVEMEMNGHSNVNEMLLNASSCQQQQEDLDLLEQMERLFTELALINEQIVDIASDHLHSAQQQLINSQKEEDKLIIEKNNLVDELNKVEKNYFDTHTRYENMRTIVKEMDNRDAINKDKVVELSEKLKEKELESRKWKQVAEDSIEKYYYCYLLLITFI